LAGPMHRIQPAERLDRALVQPAALVGPATHPGHVDLGQIHGHATSQDPIRCSQTDARPVDDPLRVQPRGDEETGDLRDEAELEVRVGREALRPAKEVPVTDVGQRRYTQSRGFDDGPAMLPVRPTLDEAVARHARRWPRLAVRLEGADDEPSAVVTDIHVTVEVAEE